MAAHNLPVPAPSDFPQVFTEALAQNFARSINQIVDRILAKPFLGMCDYESPESSWGTGDGISCNQTATVHDLASDLEFCAKHFRVVSRG